MEEYKYKIGEVFLCIKDCYMVENGSITFSKNKEYTIIEYKDMWFPYVFKNDKGDEHALSEKYLEQYFISLTREKKLNRILK